MLKENSNQLTESVKKVATAPSAGKNQHNTKDKIHICSQEMELPNPELTVGVINQLDLLHVSQAFQIQILLSPTKLQCIGSTNMSSNNLLKN